jgi:hypothetical protein
LPVTLKEQSVKYKLSEDITSQWRPFNIEKNHPTTLSSFTSLVQHWLSTEIFDYLREYSDKFEIVAKHAYWDQEKLFDRKAGGEKSHDTVPLRQFKTVKMTLQWWTQRGALTPRYWIHWGVPTPQ